MYINIPKNTSVCGEEHADKFVKQCLRNIKCGMCC